MNVGDWVSWTQERPAGRAVELWWVGGQIVNIDDKWAVVQRPTTQVYVQVDRLCLASEQHRVADFRIKEKVR